MDPIRTRTFHIDPMEYADVVFRHGLPESIARITVIFGAAVVVLASIAGAEFALGTFIVLTLYLALMVTARRGSTRAAMRDPLNRLVFEARTMTFDDWGYQASTEVGAKSEVPWKAVVMAGRMGPFTLLYLSKAYFLAVPDSAFESAEDRKAFRVLLVRHALLS